MTVANVFAIFYVVAQVIEQIVEFLEKGFCMYEGTRANIETATMEIVDNKKIIGNACGSGENITAHYEKLNKLLRVKTKTDN